MRVLRGNIILPVFLLFFFKGMAQQHPDFNQRGYTVGKIVIHGNKVTKNFIVIRELAFRKGDTLYTGDMLNSINRSEFNLNNTLLFHFVTIVPQFEGKTVRFDIHLRERWYVWPYPMIENADRNLNTWLQNKDFQRLTYGIDLWINNFRGRNEILQIKAETGFERTLAGYYSKPFIDRKKRFGIKFGGGYAMNKEVNYGSEKNRRLFYRADSPQRENIFAEVVLTYRQKLYTRQELSLKINNYAVADSITALSRDFTYLNNNQNESDFFTLSYLLKHDKRDFIIYPLRGYMFLVKARKTGLGLLPGSPDLLELYSEVHNHLRLGKRLRLSTGIYGRLNLLDDPPYLHQQGLGYGDFVRGYELYVMDAQHYFVSRNNIKFTLVKPKTKKFDFLPSEAFNTAFYAVYANLFADAGYAEDQLYFDQNPLSNKWLAGYGAGLDFVTYYDLILRMEYSLTIDGNRGLYFHFVKPI